METKMKKEGESSVRKRKVDEGGTVSKKKFDTSDESKKKFDSSGEEEASSKSETDVTHIKEKDVNTESAAGNEDDDQLEDFEIGASEHVTKQDAMKLYCLPNGTLAVCKFVEKPNPRNGAWKPMKLYLRSEIRRRGRDRFGGRQGLIDERKKREVTKLEKEMESVKDFFG